MPEVQHYMLHLYPILLKSLESLTLEEKTDK